MSPVSSNSSSRLMVLRESMITPFSSITPTELPPNILPAALERADRAPKVPERFRKKAPEISRKATKKSAETRSTSASGFQPERERGGPPPPGRLSGGWGGAPCDEEAGPSGVEEVS